MQGIPNVPQVRKAKPKPFQRPSIGLSEVKRAWQDVTPSTLQPGDILAGHGVVKSGVITEFDDHTIMREGHSRRVAELVCGEPDEHAVRLDDAVPVRAFTRLR